eukprot:GHVU01044352.1.p1 GENE.GHVU01044352.1~~GHVU01044352.1.p1  ORF type:complete len:106 (+),score=0.51 GHVU01044352.1:30-347(+)
MMADPGMSPLLSQPRGAIFVWPEPPAGGGRRLPMESMQGSPFARQRPLLPGQWAKWAIHGQLPGNLGKTDKPGKGGLTITFCGLFHELSLKYHLLPISSLNQAFR